MKSRRKKSKNPAKSKITKKTGLQTEEKYLSILKELPDIVYKIDKDGHFTFINNAIGILGYKSKDLIGQHFSKIVHPDDVKLFSRHFVLPRYKGKATGYEKAPKLIDERRTGKRKTENLEIRLIPKKSRNKEPESIIGAVIAFGDVSSAGHYDTCVIKSEKEFLGTLGIIRNITKTKQAEKKLHYQADLLQNVSNAIISTDIDFKIRTWNKAAEKMYGWKAHEVIDKSMHKITEAEYPEGETVKNIYKKLSKKGYWTDVVTERRKDGKAIIVSKSMTQIRAASGEIIGAVTVNCDITDIRHAEQKLRESEEKYRHIVESAPDGIITVDRKGIITSVNASFCKRTDYSKDNIIGKHISKIPTARLEDIPKYIKIFSALLKGKVPKSFEFRWVHKDKSVHWGEVHVSKMKKDGKIVGYQAITRDITERKANEEARRLSDEKLSLAVEAAGLGLWDQNYKTHTVYRDKQWAKMLGYTAKEIETHLKTWLELIHPDDKLMVEKMIRKHEKGSVRVFDVEHRLRTKDGQWKWIRNWGKIVERDRKGKPLRALGVHLNITERKKIEQKLSKEKILFKTIIDKIPVLLTRYDPITNILYLNREFEKIVGWKTEEAKDIDLMEKVYPDPDYRKQAMEYMQKASTEWRNFRVQSKSGKIINSEWSNIRLDDGTQIGIGIDITERKRAERRMKESEAKWQSLVENTMDVIMIVDRLGTIRYTSTPYPPYKQKEVVGKKLYHFLPKEQHIMQRKSLEKVFKTGKPDAYEASSDIPEAGIRWFSTKAVPVKSGKEVSEVILICTDITKRKRTEESLKKSSREWQTTFDSTSDLVVLQDANNNIIRVNQATVKFLGLPMEKITGRKCYRLFHGKESPLDVCPFQKTKKNKKREEAEIYISEKDLWIQVSVDPILDARGNLSGAVHIIRDITERKQAEEKIKASLQEKEALLKEVHHRVKNNLQIIFSLLNLQAGHIHDEYYKRIFQESQNRIKSMALVHEKLYRSKDLTAINVHDYVDGLLRYLCDSYGVEQNRIAIKTDIADITVDIDSAIPCGLIINELVSNSLKHGFVEPNRGSRAEITIRFHLGRKNETVLIVSDNGVGFPDGLDFKKTESLGMQLVCALTEQLSGDIKLTRGKGTTFTITFKKGN